MSKAQWSRLVCGILGVIVTGIAISAVSGTATTIAVVVAGFVITSIFAERAFRAFATPEEVRQDLEERTRAGD